MRSHKIPHTAKLNEANSMTQAKINMPEHGKDKSKKNRLALTHRRSIMASRSRSFFFFFLSFFPLIILYIFTCINVYGVNLNVLNGTR